MSLTEVLSNTGAIVPKQDISEGIKEFTYLTDETGERAREMIKFEPPEHKSTQRLWAIHGTHQNGHLYLYYHRITMDQKLDVFETFQLDGIEDLVPEIMRLYRSGEGFFNAQWNGAYPAWPADSARAAIQLGGAGHVADWLHGLAKSTNQGPPGQAHMVEEAVPAIDGGARKAPPQFPYLIDWSCSSAGAWCELVIESIFGVDVASDGSVSVESALEYFDPDARLVGLSVGGVAYDADAAGAQKRG